MDMNARLVEAAKAILKSGEDAYGDGTVEVSAAAYTELNDALEAVTGSRFGIEPDDEDDEFEDDLDEDDTDDWDDTDEDDTDDDDLVY